MASNMSKKAAMPSVFSSYFWTLSRGAAAANGATRPGTSPWMVSIQSCCCSWSALCSSSRSSCSSCLPLCSFLSALRFSASRKAVHPEGPLPPGVLKRLGAGLGEKMEGLDIPPGVAKLAAADIWLPVSRSSPGTVMVLSILG